MLTDINNINNKRILMIAPTPFFSDRGCHIRVLNSYLKYSKNNDIILLTYPIGRNLDNIQIERIKNIPGYKKLSPGFSIYKPFLDIIMYFKAKKILKKNKFDLLYCHLHEGALIGHYLRKKFEIPFIFDCQGSLTGELIENKTIKKKGIIYRILLKIEKFINLSSNIIITSTEGLKNFIINEFKYDKDIIVEKDFPDKELFNPNVKKTVKLELPKNKKIVVYLGGLQKLKGIDYLLEAIPLVSNNYHFLIMGYPMERCIEIAKNLNIVDRITFTGPIKYEDAPSYLKLGDIAVSPKTLESREANAKIYNYIAMNLPVICFDMPETRKIAEEFREAKIFFVEEKNIQKLADTIQRIIF